MLIYDNSKDDHSVLVNNVLKDRNYEYFYNGCNDGISKSFNYIFSVAKDIKIDYVLLLDQDSVIESGQINNIKATINKNKSFNYCLNVCFNKISKTNPDTVLFAITSGMIVNTKFYLSNGGYDEKLFIDGVDHDYCIRLLKLGEPIYLIKDAHLKQRLGSGEKNFLGVYEHSAMRNYYIFRNRLYLINKHRDYYTLDKKIRFFYLSIAKQVLSIIISEKYKFEKLKYLVIAFRDYKNEKFGKLEW